MTYGKQPKQPPEKGISAAWALNGFLTSLVVVFGVIVLAVLSLMIQQQFKTQNYSDTEHDVVAIGDQITSFINDRIVVLQDYARFPIIILAAQQQDERKESISKFMDELSVMGIHPKLTLLNEDGSLIHQTSEQPVFNYQGQPWLMDMLKHKKIRHSMVSSAGQNHYWRLAAPVLYREKVEGVLIIEIPFVELDNTLQFSSMMHNGQIQLLHQGQKVASFGPTIEGDPHSLYLPRQDVTLHYRAGGNPLAGMQKNLILSVGIILLIIALITVRLSIQLGLRSFVRPLEQLRIMASTLSHGNHTVSAPINSGIKEIQLLVQDFNTMAQTIRDRELQLVNAQQTLEVRVVERTEDLKESHERIASILRTIQSGIMVIDPESLLIIEANEACSAMIGMPSERIIGQSCSRFSQCTKLTAGSASLAAGISVNDECTLVAQTGETLTVLKTTVPIRFAGRQHMLVSFVDISKRKQAEKALKEARQLEVQLAAHIQEKLLLGQPPERIGNMEIGAITIPSQTVSGDFYDYHEWNTEMKSMDLIFGDVMGKGINAALLGAGVKTAWHQSLVSSLEEGWWAGIPPTHDIVQKLHARIVPELMAFESFITLCYARLNTADQMLEYVHCGHTQIIHWKPLENCCDLLEGNSPPLGMLETEQYETKFVSFKPCDCFIFFSDGITECEDATGEFFGIERLCAVVEKMHMQTTEGIIEAIRQAISVFSNSTEYADDLSCIIVKAGQLPESHFLDFKASSVKSLDISVQSEIQFKHD